MGPSTKPFDLEKRTNQFADRCRAWQGTIPQSEQNLRDCKRLIRSSGSVAATFIEAANVGKWKEFVLRIKIAQKEATESYLWLRLCDAGSDMLAQEEQTDLQNEAVELSRIFGAIIEEFRHPAV